MLTPSEKCYILHELKKAIESLEAQGKKVDRAKAYRILLLVTFVM